MRIVLIFGVGVALTACSAGSGPKGGRLDVVASFYPIYEAARTVGGSDVAAYNLTPPGVEPHDLELSPKQLDRILGADVVFYLGRGFQPAVQAAVGQRHDGHGVDLLAALGGNLRTVTSGESVQGGVDPHVWLDPVLMMDIVDQVRDAMVKARPADAASFRRNADQFDTKLRAIDQEFRTGLSACQHTVVVTAHGAFGYLAARYGLTQEPIAGISPEAEPDPKRLAELADLVKREAVTTIFTEELVSPRVADTLAREAGVKTAVLNPLEGLTKDEVARGDDYLSVMRSNLQALRTALGCR
jgi:zinc transport system substrate-binding protein